MGVDDGVNVTVGGSGVRVDVGIGVIVGVDVFVPVGVIVGVLEGVNVNVGSGVFEGVCVIVGVDVLVAVGVIVGIDVLVAVSVILGVMEGVGVNVGSGVFEGVGVAVGVRVMVGVLVGVQDIITLGTASRRSWQPLSKSIITPKSLLTTPVSTPPPAQSKSKSITQGFELPLLNGRDPLQLVGESESITPSPFTPKWI